MEATAKKPESVPAEIKKVQERNHKETAQLLLDEILRYEQGGGALDGNLEILRIQLLEIIRQDIISDKEKEIIQDAEEVIRTLIEQGKVPPKKSLLGRLKSSKLGRALMISAGLGSAASAASHIRFTSAEAAATQQLSEGGKSFENKAGGFKERASSNLPTEVTVGDIDPRYLQIDELESRAAMMEDGKEKKILLQEIEDMKRSVLDGTGWADKGRQDLFKLILNNRDIRNILQSEPGLTVADTFSLIKATIMYEGSGTYEEKLERLLAERRELLSKEFIGPNTDSVIIFNYAAKDAGSLFKGEKLVEMAKVALGSGGAKADTLIQLISTAEAGEHDKTKENAGDRLRQSIERSRGETLIYLNTHTSGEEIAIDLSDTKNPQTLKLDGMASALLNRLHGSVEKEGKEQGLESLGKLKLVIDGCEGYDFATKLVGRMRDLYESGYKPAIGVDFDQLKLPNIVTMAGEASKVVVLDESGGSHALTSKRYLDKIKAEGMLSGKILFDLQAESYLSRGDMTFFVGKGGKLVEISAMQPDKIFQHDGGIYKMNFDRAPGGEEDKTA